VFRELSNGFATCEDPDALQDICDRLGPGVIRVFAERWWARLPLPFTQADRDAGYWWDISMRQVEVATTIVFTAPRHARVFFEALAADNLDLGRPDNMEIIFNRQIRSTCSGVFRTAIDRTTTGWSRASNSAAGPAVAIPSTRSSAAATCRSRSPDGPGIRQHRQPDPIPTGHAHPAHLVRRQTPPSRRRHR
jgi:hypothetical protein